GNRRVAVLLYVKLFEGYGIEFDVAGLDGRENVLFGRVAAFLFRIRIGGSRIASRVLASPFGKARIQRFSASVTAWTTLASGPFLVARTREPFADCAATVSADATSNPTTLAIVLNLIIVPPVEQICKHHA